MSSPLGRQQLALYPEQEVAQMGASAFQEMKGKVPLSRDLAAERYVSCVAREIVAAIDAPDAPRGWEVELFQDDQVNAFALPGGKIGVYTGMLRVAENQDQLAAVLGHEVSHVLAHHTNERLSTSAVAQTGLDLAQVVAGGSSPAQQQLFGLLGLGAQVGVLLPFDRTQESEADLLGLQLMARAGFDPRQAVELWRNMERAEQGAPPEFLSTHPSSSRRIAQLEAAMPKAMTLYQRAQASGRHPNCQPS